MSFKNANQALQRFIINKNYSTPRYESIDAMLNARGLNTTILDGDTPVDGKLRTLKISYYPIDCNAVADDCSQTICTTGTVAEPVQELFRISRCIATKPKTLRVEDIRDVDGNWNFSAHAMAQINAMIGSARKALAQEIDTLLIAKAGLQLDGNPTKRVTMVDTTTGVVQPVGMWEIEQDFSDGGFTNPFIIGSKEVFQWRKALSIATDNTSRGQAIAKLGETNMYYDTLLNSVAGNTASGEHILAFDPQALKFVSYNKNVGIFATGLASPEQLDRLYQQGGTDYMKGVLRDPATGILWDYYLNFDKCIGEDGAFTFFLRLYWDIYFPKIQACNIQGVNGIFHYRTCPVKIPTCPGGDTPSPAIASRVFSWNPSFAYPLYVANAIVGGQTTAPNTNVASDADTVSLLNDAYGVPGFFTLVGSTIQYTGNVAITVSFNDGDVTGSFA